MKNILVVEDNEKTLCMLEKAIVSSIGDVTVYKATDYETAIKEAFSKEIDVFLIDIILDTTTPGDTSGIKFASQVREHESYLFTPIIFITALYDPELYAYKELHSFGYLEKPFSVQKAIDLIKSALRYHSPVREKEMVYLRKEGILYAVRLDEIVYAESQNHILLIKLLKDVMEIPYMTIKKFASLVDRRDFVQCSRSAIVNKKYIKYVDVVNRFISFNVCDEKVVIGTTYKKKVYEEFFDVQ